MTACSGKRQEGRNILPQTVAVGARRTDPSEPVLLPWPLSDPVPDVGRLLESFLARRSAETTKAYRQDMADFRAFAQRPSGHAVTAQEAAGLLLASGHGAANALALEYKSGLGRRQL